MLYIYIGLGGFCGALARFFLENLIQDQWAAFFPIGTFVINLCGCILIGFTMTLFMERLLVNPMLRISLTSGFIGGMTTFSTFSYESISLWEKGLWKTSAIYVASSVSLGFLAVWMGIIAARIVAKLIQSIYVKLELGEYR